MYPTRHPRTRSGFWFRVHPGRLSLLALAVLITSCASAADRTMESISSSALSGEQEAAVPESAPAEGVQPVADVPQPLPQLVKRAELMIEVSAVEEAIDQAVAIARGAGGDLLGLSNQSPPNESVPQVASLEIRVPQARLETVLDQLSQLGQVEQQFLTAEDVSAQLVDYEARLRNLRKAEETVLGIMDRSGEISEVLQVAQELRNIRQSIEQIDGELASLRNRVNYSTITLSLEAKAAGTPSQITVITQLGDSWQGATRSMATFTVNLIQIGIWLLVYSPYWLLLAGMGYWLHRLLKGDRPSSADR
ncbi:MAG: DUF4349 domain-containing protein [Synechococcales bacterium]|nr:DUF4349 domain-containing protein [Synechococcales bacterium]